MKIETLKERIKKANEKIEKSTKTLERHNSQLSKKSKVLTDKGIDLKNYDKYNRDIIDYDTYWDLCDYEHKLEDITSTKKKISEVTATLKKLQKQLDDQLAKDEAINNVIPEVLNVFLENWKQKCFEFYVDLANEYLSLELKNSVDYELTVENLKMIETKKYTADWKAFEMVQKYSDEEIEKILNNEYSDYEMSKVYSYIKYETLKKFRQSHFASDMIVIDKIIVFNAIDTDILNYILDEDVKIKKEMFISRVKEVIGDIVDLTGLRIGGNGEINGIAKGVKCNAKIDTITAGGYNIQCYHFRVLVNTVK